MQLERWQERVGRRSDLEQCHTRDSAVSSWQSQGGLAWVGFAEFGWHQTTTNLQRQIDRAASTSPAEALASYSLMNLIILASSLLGLDAGLVMAVVSEES